MRIRNPVLYKYFATCMMLLKTKSTCIIRMHFSLHSLLDHPNFEYCQLTIDAFGRQISPKITSFLRIPLKTSMSNAFIRWDQFFSKSTQTCASVFRLCSFGRIRVRRQVTYSGIHLSLFSSVLTIIQGIYWKNYFLTLYQTAIYGLPMLLLSL